MAIGLDIIIPSLAATSEYLDLCLTCINKNKVLPNTKIYVWLNEYSDSDGRKLANKFPEVVFLLSPQNRGQCEPVNRIASRFCRNPFIFVMNDDMIVGPEFDKHLISAYEYYQNRYGTKQVICPQIIEMQREPERNLPNYYLQKEFGDSVKSFQEEAFYLFCKNNSAPISPRTKFTLPFIMNRLEWYRFGGYDEAYEFGAKSDDDLNFRLEMLGYARIQLQNVFCYHFGSKATFRNDERKLWWNQILEQNNQTMHNKWS